MFVSGVVAELGWGGVSFDLAFVDDANAIGHLLRDLDDLRRENYGVAASGGCARILFEGIQAARIHAASEGLIDEPKFGIGENKTGEDCFVSLAAGELA